MRHLVFRCRYVHITLWISTLLFESRSRYFTRNEEGLFADIFNRNMTIKFEFSFT